MALLSVADALERVLAHAAPLPAEEVPLVRGRTAACSPTDLKALRTQPPADRVGDGRLCRARQRRGARRRCA